MSKVTYLLHKVTRHLIIKEIGTSVPLKATIWSQVQHSYDEP